MEATQQQAATTADTAKPSPITVVKQNIYLLPGLLADERVFKNFVTDNNTFFGVDYPHPHRRETIAHFAKRVAEQITEPNPVLIGTSFGGILSVEIAKHIPVKQLVLVGSVKHADELAWYKNIVYLARLHRRVPMPLVKMGSIASRFFAPNETRELEVFSDMVYSHNDDYIRWVIDRVLGWRNTEYPENLLHLHGTKDPLFPIRYIKNPVPIVGAGHSMVLDRAECLRKEIEENTGLVI